MTRKLLKDAPFKAYKLRAQGSLLLWPRGPRVTTDSKRSFYLHSKKQNI